MNTQLFLIEYNDAAVGICNSKENTINFINEHFNINLPEEKKQLQELKYHLRLNYVSPKDLDVNRQLVITQVEPNTYLE